MKKSRLLEIIREEISSALREGEAEERAAKAAELKAIDAKQKALDAERKDTMKGGALEEDQLNEMAYDIIVSQPNELAKLQDKIKDSTKKGEQKLAKALEIIQKTKKEGKPIRQRDIANEMGVIQQEINPLINKLIDVGILEKGESVTGVTKKKVTDKAQGRPTSAEPKTKTEKAPKAEPKKAEEEDDEVAAATKAISGDETAKDLGKAADVSKNPDFDRIRKGLQTKRKNSKEGVLSPENMKLAIDIINSAKDKYKFNATQVDSLRADIGL